MSEARKRVRVCLSYCNTRQQWLLRLRLGKRMGFLARERSKLKALIAATAVRLLLLVPSLNVRAAQSLTEVN